MVRRRYSRRRPCFSCRFEFFDVSPNESIGIIERKERDRMLGFIVTKLFEAIGGSSVPLLCGRFVGKNKTCMGDGTAQPLGFRTCDRPIYRTRTMLDRSFCTL
jgi:hypothetical protein